MPSRSPTLLVILSRWRRFAPPGLAAVVVAIFAACGSRSDLLVDDPLVDAAADGGDATVDADLPDGAEAGDAGADAPGACRPRSCAEQGFQCGANGDGCGNLLDCGKCPPGEVCGAQAYSRCAKGPPCKPRNCTDLGFSCGPAGDGCGGVLQCGICQWPDSCGGKGVPGSCGNSRPCTNLCLQQVPCGPGATTTITGTVVAGTLPAFGAPDPIYNALVYVPNAPVAPFPAGVSCNHCGVDVSGEPLVATNTAANGTFTLTNVPVGSNIPLVIQLGRWRRVVTIPTVTACGTTALPPALTRMPRNQAEGDIPKMAIATGRADGLECVLMKMGIDLAEFTQPSGTGRVHMYVANGADLGPGTPPASQLTGSSAALAGYDMVLLPCEGSPVAKIPTQQQNLVDYTSAGGRLFTTHYSYTWLHNIAPFSSTATFNGSTTGSPATTTGIVDTSFLGGQALSAWMGAVGALSGPDRFPIAEPRHNLDAVAPSSQRYVSDSANGKPLQYAFPTPVGAAPASQCGRVVFGTFHVVSATLTNGTTFPAACRPGPMTAQEKDLEFMLLDLANCIPDVPQNCTPRTCADQGISCGPAGDGCGSPINCGACTPPATCGGTTNYQCGTSDAGTCTPRTCVSQGFNCGANGDGCGNAIACGACTAPETCGGGGKPGVCGKP